MKKVYIITALACFFILASQLKAQMNYTVSYPTMTYSAITGTSPTLTLAYPPTLAAIDGASQYDEGAANNIILPFPFIFNCVPYSICHISTNGFISLGAPLDTLNAYWNNDLKAGPLNYSDNTMDKSIFSRPLIAPLWDDLDLTANTNIVYNTTGTAPNRIFTVQWSNVRWSWQAAFASINFQVKLYETTNEIIFHYRNITPGTLSTTASASVGLASCSHGVGNFLSLSNLSNLATISNSNSTNTINSKPASNFAVKFTPTQCSQILNSGKCHSKPLIYGQTFYDYNSNGVQDIGENFCSNVKITLSNGNSTFSSKNGYFYLFADSLGSYTLSVDTLNVYKPFPQYLSYNISTYDTILHTLAALQPFVTKDSMKLNITPLMWRPRPGFSYPYYISYQNIGTTSISPTLNFDYNGSKLILDSFTNTSILSSLNNLKLDINNIQPGQTGYFIAYFRVKPTVPLGDSIVVDANLTYTTNVRLAALVGGSYDPNDKAATPVLTPTQVALGKDIDYTIRFQNTGTDTAFTVIIDDTLSNDLLANTLVLVGSSHNCKTTVEKNVVHFEFFNILLPDSNINETGSHGFVSFKIKPKPTLTNGSSVSNKAFIYFDYNAPVITNTAITQINTSGIVTPVKFTSYDLKMMNDRAINNIWVTASEINTSYFNIQRSFDGISFETVGKTIAKGKGTYSYTDLLTNNNLPKSIYYRIQVIDNDGKYQFSEIKLVNLNSNSIKGISIYPNPAKETITIICNDAKEFFIIDFLGKEIIKKKTFNNSSAIVNVQNLTKGVYIVKVITSSGEIKTEKLIIE